MLEAEHVQVGIQCVSLFHVNEDIGEKTTPKAFTRNAVDNQANFLGKMVRLIGHAFPALNQKIELRLTEFPQCGLLFFAVFAHFHNVVHFDC